MAENTSPAQELVALRAGALTAAAELTAANDLLAEAQGQVTALTARAETAEANAARLAGELGTASTNLSAVTGERDVARGETTALKAAINTGGQFSMAADGKSIALTATGVNHFLAAELAKGGHRPLAIGGRVDNAASATTPDPKLTAHERAVAATNAQPAVAAYIAAHNSRN